MSETTNNGAYQFEIVRTFNAPRQKVWQAWTTESSLLQWWGPKGFKMLAGKLELKPGGVFHYGMQTPDGNEMWGKFIYREIHAPDRLVFVNCFSDKDGNTCPNPWMPVWPLETLNVVSFEEVDGKTVITLRGAPINPTPEELKAYEGLKESMQQGFSGTWAQLDEYLAHN